MSCLLIIASIRKYFCVINVKYLGLGMLGRLMLQPMPGCLADDLLSQDATKIGGVLAWHGVTANTVTLPAGMPNQGTSEYLRLR
jgi:hypothetical protein